MHKFKHGELGSGPGGKSGKVKSRRQAIAIALEEAGASRNKSNLRRTKKKEAQWRTGQQGARGQVPRMVMAKRLHIEGARR